MTKTQKRIYDANIDIVDWLACLLSDKDFDLEMLLPVVGRFYREAAERFAGDESEFEDFTVLFVRRKVSEYKIINPLNTCFCYAREEN